MTHLSPSAIRSFRKKIYAHYCAHGRHDLLWRADRTPYRIVVSEMMLQQTQVPRVIVKFPSFIENFPSFRSIAAAPLKEVLAAWQGLGYNRRAVSLKRLAGIVMTERGGKLPDSLDELMTLPGIGHATASCILAFAFDRPVVFIETNIRSVFIQHFFRGRTAVRDDAILPLVDATLDREHPRDWYYALMDYGVMLKKANPNPSRKSAHYKKQSPFHGSDRQLRGRIVKLLIASGGYTSSKLAKLLNTDPARVRAVIASLVRDDLVISRGSLYKIAG